MRKILFATLLGLLTILSGCGVKDNQIDIILDHEEGSGSSYELVMVEKMDVTDTVTLSLSYGATETEEYAFNLKNAKIEFVYVKKGDMVKKGDVLATLESEDIETKISNLEHDIAVKNLELKQLLERKAFEIETEEYLLNYTYKEEREKEKEKTEEAIEKIEKRYAPSIKTYEDEIYILKLRLAEAKQDYKNSRIEATVDGVVSFCKTNLEGTMVVPGDAIIKVYDTSKCLFTSYDKDKAEYVDVNREYLVDIGFGSAFRTIAVRAAKVSDWGSMIYFEPVDSEETISVNDHGKLNIVIHEALSVNAIPTTALHKSDDRYYVYYLDENAVRRMRFVTPGLIGNEYTEIVKGLDEGEYIIAK